LTNIHVLEIAFTV